MQKFRDTVKVALQSDGTLSCLAGLQLSREENESYLEAARRAGVDVHQWARDVLNDAANRTAPGQS